MIPTIAWTIWLLGTLALGLAAGSFLNVAAVRLPYEKSVIWPSSRCGNCLKGLPWHSNLPIIGYLWLRGRCYWCGEVFSIRYLLVELLVGFGFVGLFLLEVVFDIRNAGWWRDHGHMMHWGIVPWQAWAAWSAEAVFFAFLMAASLCDFEHHEIPLDITITGLIVGLLFSVAMPWPFPAQPIDVENAVARHKIEHSALYRPGRTVPGGALAEPVFAFPGMHPWPVAWPLPAWLVPGTATYGLVSGLLGAMAGSLVCRGIRSVYGLGRGRESLGIGDSDLLLMAGAFTGWQVVVVGFFMSIIPGLILGIGYLVIRGSQTLPFGPALGLGVFVTWMGWRWIGPSVADVLFDPWILGFLAIAGLGGLLTMSWMLRVVRGPDENDDQSPVVRVD